MTLWLNYWQEYLSSLTEQDKPPVEHPNTHNTLLKGGSYNCRVLRDPNTVRKFVAELMQRKDRHFLTLSESAGYVDALKRIPGTQLMFGGEVAIIVRDGVTVSEAHADIRFKKTWPRKDGREHTPRILISAMLNGWARVAAIHVPPAGPDRIPARHEYLHGLAAWCDQHPGPLILSGDWNYSPNDPEIRRLANGAGMTIARSGGIDYAMARGVNLLNMHHHWNSGGSDHLPILYRVTPK